MFDYSNLERPLLYQDEKLHDIEGDLNFVQGIWNMPRNIK